MIFNFLSISELVRFGVVGLTSNVIIFCFYLGLTGVGVGHKISMSLLFAVSSILTFVVNKKWTFRQKLFSQFSLIKYIIIYSFAYSINLMAMFFLVDKFGYSHQIVQGVMIVTLSAILFPLLKFWVFRLSIIIPNQV